MYYLTVRDEFSAAHSIEEYPGECERLHGHNWQVEATVRAEQLNELGLAIDFRKLKQALKTILDRLDHYYLNEIEPFNTLNPTSENLARFIFEEFRKQIAVEGIEAESVAVWENDRSAAKYREA